MHKVADATVNNAFVTSFVARCLLEPRYATRLRTGGRHPARVDQAGDMALRVFRQIDVERVRLFGGFISRVKHNFLWNSLPVARTVLRHRGDELELFASFRERYPPLFDQRLTQAEKIRRFTRYLTHVSTFGTAPGSVALRDLIRHESMMWELKGLWLNRGIRRHGGSVGRQISLARLLTWRPSLDGYVRLATFRSDPFAACRDYEVGRIPRLRARKARHYCYRVRGGHLDVLQLSSPQYQVLTSVDGSRTVESIVGHCGNRWAVKRLLLLQSFFADGILRRTTVTPEARQCG